VRVQSVACAQGQEVCACPCVRMLNSAAIRSQRPTLTLASIASCCSRSLACFSRSAWVQQQPMHKNTCTTAQATRTQETLRMYPWVHTLR
jgi:hypothetical protein